MCNQQAMNSFHARGFDVVLLSTLVSAFAFILDIRNCLDSYPGKIFRDIPTSCPVPLSALSLQIKYGDDVLLRIRREQCSRHIFAEMFQEGTTLEELCRG